MTKMKITVVVVLAVGLFHIHYAKLTIEEKISFDDCLMDAVHNFTDFGETIVIHCSSNYCGTYFDKLFTQIKLLSLSPNGVVNMGREVHIVELDTYQDTKAILTKLKPLTSWNPNAQFVVVFHDKMVSKAIETIFEMLWSLNIYNAVVYSFKEGRSIYFWYPYFKNVTVMGSCEVGPDIKARKPSFGDIPKVLIPNPLKVEIVIHPPYITSKSEGLDIQIVKEFARIFNTELLISHSAKPYDYGMIFFNGTATGMSGEVFHKRVDMGVGSFILQPERFEYLDSSYPYYNEMYYWCVPRARRIISWRQVFATLQWQTWLLILFIFVAYTMILYLLSLMEVKESFYKKFSNSVFNNFAIFIGASGHVLPRSQSVRVYTLFWIVICLILNIVYQTQFISLMERGLEERQIQNMDELLESDLEIQMKSSSPALFGESHTLQKFIAKGYSKCEQLMDCMNKVAYSRNASLFSSASYVDYIKNRFYDDDNFVMFFCFDGGINLSPMYVAMRRGFGLKNFVDEIVIRIVEGGLIDLWRKRVYLKRTWKVGRKSDVKSMDFAFFQAPLFCWAVGIGLSICVFIGEILKNNYGKRGLKVN
jgi:hypothetical protein